MNVATRSNNFNYKKKNRKEKERKNKSVMPSGLLNFCNWERGAHSKLSFEYFLNLYNDEWTHDKKWNGLPSGVIPKSEYVIS